MKNIIFIVVACIIMACSTKSTTENRIIIPEAPLLKSKKEGYFRAIGTEPFWSLEISEEMIQFQGVEADNKFTALHSEPVDGKNVSEKLYHVQTDDVEMIVTVSMQNCSDSMSDRKYGYKVEINLKKNNQKENLNYLGCGNYIADYRLFDNWLLEELDGKKISIEDFTNEIPTIEINASEKKFSGKGGCNRISGIIFQERELLRFTDIVSTKMACGETNRENIFLLALKNSTGYKIKNNRLYLINSDGVKVIFKKID